MLNSTATLKPNGLGKLNFSFGSSQDQKLSPQAFIEWRKYIYDLCGIYFQDNKKYLLESRLQKRIKHLKIDSLEKYLQYLKTNPLREQEKKQLFEAITINETYFFRNQPQLEALITSIVPELIKTKLGAFNKIRIWSAASSTGQEIYSIIIMLKELYLDPQKYEIQLLGTDISNSAIVRASYGKYNKFEIARGLPPEKVRKYFIPDGDSWKIERRNHNKDS